MITLVMLQEFMSANVPHFNCVVGAGGGEARPTGVKLGSVYVPGIKNIGLKLGEHEK